MFVADQVVILTPFIMPDKDDPETPELCKRWLELADTAFNLDEARKEQKKIKDLINADVEKYKRITGRRK